MPIDPLDVPPGSLTLEAITDLLEGGGGGTPSGNTGDVQFNNAGAFDAAPGGLFSYDPVSGATQIITTSGLSGMALEIPGAGQPEAIQILAQDPSNGGGTVDIESAGQMSFVAANMEFNAPSGVFSITTQSIQIGTPTTTYAMFGVPPVGQPNVTGSKGGNAALASLITALKNLGFITDSTT